MNDSVTIRRAILSVSDKSGIIELGRFLAGRGVEILSTGGTANHLAGAGVAVIPVSSWSGAPEILGGRVKTLTPRVFGAILFDRDDPSHAGECDAQNIPPIDLVVVNLYPFEATIARPGVGVAEAVEQIDIGGPSMLRAAAKNFRHVIALSNPSLYGELMRQLEQGEVTEAFRRDCALEVFRTTSAYDAKIAEWLGTIGGEAAESERTPEVLQLAFRKKQDLRYGENPRQQAAFYVRSDGGGDTLRQLQGKDLSYNNLLDLDAALRLAMSFDDPACAVIKHTNPCGVATAVSLDEAVRLALEADPLSAFGGIVAVNREISPEAAMRMAAMFLEVVIAPSFSEEAVDAFRAKKNLRLVSSRDFENAFELRTAAGGILLQSRDSISSIDTWKRASKRVPTMDEIRSLEFAWIVCAHVKSNAIVLARSAQSVGIGAGQMSRIDAAKLAISKATGPTAGTVAASDAFFPFRDGVDVLAGAGVTAIVQPGGSVRDEEVIAAADEHGISMLFTGERHFRH
ncbi:MAG TPA: bifunctional phosphoribosylaminoimidazolecarboxamide formyltransferase/IMP cyclohydrolase [Thermoanaerobaculia bacterium]|nr:bifunctional phosphoribosylaminoimidazolecarboxamide formyltransferase/IMP cyclohydrolase [Thermoanaerobaculia bacterium]